MIVQLYAHPFSSYSQKVLIALYENGTPFEFCMLDGEHPEHMTTLLSHWPIGKFPLLIDEGQVVMESTPIIEHLAQHHAGEVMLLPADRALLAEVRLLDRPSVSRAVDEARPYRPLFPLGAPDRD
jgi:glutathione S-transferase